MSKFKEDIIIFGDLCNKSLKDTYLYFDRDPNCMFEMINNMKPFLKPENIIFAMKDGVEIGCVFWHPDYNEVIPGGRKNSMLGIGIRYMLNRSKIKKIKINVIGVLPKYWRLGTAVGLINEVYKYTKTKYEVSETNFVWDCNKNSRDFNLRYSDREDRHYNVYCFEEENSGAV